MQFNFKGKYDPTQSYYKKDVVSYQLTPNDTVRFYFCLTDHTSSTPQTPSPSGDTNFWGFINTLSNFPNSVDTFMYRTSVQAQDKPEIDRLNELFLKTNLTSAEADELNTLTVKYRNKYFTAEDANAIQQSITNMQMFFKNNVEGYINSMVALVDTAKDNALNAIEQKKNGVIDYLDGTEAGKMRNDIGVMADLSTVDKGSLVKAINEVNAKAPADASTTQKGIVQLDDTVTSTDITKAATANSVRQSLENAKDYIDQRPWQKQPLTNGEVAIEITDSDIHSYLPTGFYKGLRVANAPTTGYWYFEVIRHAPTYSIVNAYPLDINAGNGYRQKRQVNGIWGAWSDDLFTSVSSGKANIETAITGKGSTVSKAGSVATFSELVTGINSIQQGVFQRYEGTMSGTSTTVAVGNTSSWLGQFASLPANTRTLSILPTSVQSSNNSYIFLNTAANITLAYCLQDSEGRLWTIGPNADPVKMSTYLFLLGLMIDLETGLIRMVYRRGTVAGDTVSTYLSNSGTKPTGFNTSAPMQFGYRVTSNTNTSTNETVSSRFSSATVISM